MARRRPRLAVSFKETRSRTKQMFADGTRVDNILKRYATAGVDATVAPYLFGQQLAAAPFGVDQGRDYQQQLSAVTAVREYFEALPSRIRERFGNQPSRLVEFLGDERNREEAEKLGLVKPAEKPAGKPVDPPAKPVEPPAGAPVKAPGTMST